MSERIVVTGIGAVTPFGDGVDVLWQSLIGGHTAAREWDDLRAEGFRVTVACRVPGHGPDDATRGQRLGLAAAREAIACAGLPLSDTIAVCIGTTMGESVAFEQAAAGAPFRAGSAAANVFPRALADALHINGPVRAYATACAAGNYAVGAGADLIRSGAARAALVGGVEPFSRIAMVGFSRARAMTPDVCRPFDRNRAGMQLGEAAAFLVLERESDARARGAAPLAAIRALGLSCDAFHPTAPRPDGSGMAEAMRRALHEAGIAAGDVGWIAAHGSGTVASDAAEAMAIRATFGREQPPVSGLKGALGHSMGAATAVSAIAMTLTFRDRVLPPTATLLEIDPQLDLNVIAHVMPAPALRYALNCGYGFGGLNSALLMEAA
jgi:3-oxoacyl-[acyl-carrier-protein] synthase II